MFQRIDCVCIHTDNLVASCSFYADMGLVEAWRLERVTETGQAWALVGLSFPAGNTELVLSTHPDRLALEVEIRVADVRASHAALSSRGDVAWIAEPFAIEEGHVAVMRAPDGNVFVLIGA